VVSRANPSETTFWARAGLVALLVTSGACADDVPGMAATTDADPETSTGDAATTALTTVDLDTTGAASTTSGDPTQGPADTTMSESTTSESTTGESTTGESTTGESTTGESSSTGLTPECGDGLLDVGETCDGAELAGEDCVSQGFVGGVLACLGDCSGFDSTGCMAAASGDCCAAHRATGCDDAGCEAAICAFDPFCCDTAWDGICADEALTTPACLDVGGACPCPDEDVGGAMGLAVTSGNTSGDDDDIDGSCGGSGGNDRVVLFTAPANGSYSFDTFGSGYDTKLSLHADCATELACNDDADGGVQSQVTRDMVAGQHVRVVVDGYNGATGDWVLNITLAPMLPQVCGDAVVAAPELCDGPNLNGQTCLFQGFPGGGVLACAPDCFAFDTTGCIDGPYACSDEDIGGTTGAAVAAGDTNGDDNDLDGSCGGAGGNDHVVTFTAPVAAMYTFDTFGSAFDTKLGLYADCMSELYCNDDTGGLQSQLSINMGAGQDVLVVIDGYDGSTGAWVLNVTQS